MRRSPTSCQVRLWPQASAGRDHRRPAVVDGVDDLASVDSLEVDRRDAEVRMSELSMDDPQRDPFVRHPGGVSMPQLLRRESPPDSRLRGEPAQLTAGSGR